MTIALKTSFVPLVHWRGFLLKQCFPEVAERHSMLVLGFENGEVFEKLVWEAFKTKGESLGLLN